MQVILIKDVRECGKKMDVKNVPDGYARNFLIPRGLAKIATEDELKKLSREINEIKAKKDKLDEKREKEIQKTKGLNLIFGIKTDQKGGSFGSVTKKNIDDALIKNGINIGKCNLDKPIKKIGSYEVEVDFGNGLSSDLKISVISEKQR